MTGAKAAGTPGRSPLLFFETASAYERTEALKAAIDLDLFTRIAEGRRNRDELAVACRASPRGVRILADYLTALGFLIKDQDGYALTADTNAFLNRNSPDYLGEVIDYLTAPQLRACFGSLADAVRRGGTAVTGGGVNASENPIWVTFARVMGPVMRLTAAMLARMFAGDPARPLHVLDVAAGHGGFGIAIAERCPKAAITALDWPNVLEVTAANAVRAGFGDRLTWLPGNALEVDWGGPYDLILLANFLHHFDHRTCEQLAIKAHAATASGGQVVVLEYIADEARLSLEAIAFALAMLATTAGGDAYTFAAYEQMFSRAGFARSELRELPLTSQQVVVNYKA